jgi:hypothetical protein
MTLPNVHILYENPAWLPPLVDGLQAEGFTYKLHEVWQGMIDPCEAPAEGIYLNRMSPSSHTRGHLESVDLTQEILAWLEGYGRHVINGAQAFQLEVSKFRQAMALERHGILTPRTVLCVGTEQLVAAARTFEGPFITKHNQGGKGLGIQLFNSAEEVETAIKSDGWDPGPKGQMVVQQYIEAASPYITRVELVGDRFLYAMRSATTDGFELCPSDACQVPTQTPDVCPIDGDAKFSASPLKADDPLVAQYLRLMKAEKLEIAGIEFVEDRQGRRYTYDINGTTNYNSGVARDVGIDGMRELARYLKQTHGVAHQSMPFDSSAARAA